MYEAEVNRGFESIEMLPAVVVARFGELRSEVVARSLLPWGEHCTECTWPTCYTTCELFSPRMDGNCRLFVDGMVRVDVRESLTPYLLKIRFKRWGKLWAIGNLALYDSDDAQRQEKRNMAVGALARSLPLPGTLRSKVQAKVAYIRRRTTETAPVPSEQPDWFLLECYNPGEAPVDLTFTVRPRRPGSHSFQQVIRAACGFVRAQIPVSDIGRMVDLAQPFEVEIVPNDADGTVLYFGIIDFVKTRTKPKPVAVPSGMSGDSNESSSKGKTWKCIVWDLDNTLWDGTLIEDGPDGIRVRPEIVATIKELDQRGILHSVASKNNHEDVMRVLRAQGLDEYFLHPQISWDPKSQAVARIAKLLNIGIDTLAFVDDQMFEREEVRTSLPQVAVVDASEAAQIVARPECLVPVTEEARQRRLMYRQETEREQVLESFHGEYTKFLRECDLQVHLSRLNNENLERVYELAQRTNQMNFSGARYPRAQLQELQQSTAHETCVIRCSDRFGNYGIVGFAVIEVHEPRLIDLMFSCRIQAKRVEHAFLSYVIQKHSGVDRRDFFANFRKTERNAAHGRVFDDVGFELVEARDGVLTLVFRKDKVIPQEGIVRIVEEAGDAR